MFFRPAHRRPYFLALPMLHAQALVFLAERELVLDAPLAGELIAAGLADRADGGRLRLSQAGAIAARLVQRLCRDRERLPLARAPSSRIAE